MGGGEGWIDRKERGRLTCMYLGRIQRKMPYTGRDAGQETEGRKRGAEPGVGWEGACGRRGNEIRDVGNDVLFLEGRSGPKRPKEEGMTSWGKENERMLRRKGGWASFSYTTTRQFPFRFAFARLLRSSSSSAPPIKGGRLRLRLSCHVLSLPRPSRLSLLRPIVSSARPYSFRPPLSGHPAAALAHPAAELLWCPYPTFHIHASDRASPAHALAFAYLLRLPAPAHAQLSLSARPASVNGARSPALCCIHPLPPSPLLLPPPPAFSHRPLASYLSLSCTRPAAHFSLVLGPDLFFSPEPPLPRPSPLSSSPSSLYLYLITWESFSR
ncbi:hypothetical protein C8Q73DRAFT_230335 [Cubamyces lactineus]|nr:hypothetical protein C8Q73DRAFT_230335 [Cubamyces lactineus]